MFRMPQTSRRGVDPNGILNVSAKDLGTNKQNTIVIKAGSGLSDAEIESMINEAEKNKEEDEKKKRLIEARNNADQLIYTTERSLKEFGDKISAADKSAIEEKLQNLKDATTTEDITTIENAVNELTSAAHKLAEAVYGGAAQAGANPNPDAGQQTGEYDQNKDDDVVDANFTEKK